VLAQRVLMTVPQPDFSTEALLSERFEGGSLTVQHYARLATAFSQAGELWKKASTALASGDTDGASNLKAQAIKAGAYALTLTNKPIG